MKITKLGAAGVLLDAACDHFLRGDLVTAVHCAGAVEEICGRYAETLGETTIPNAMWAAHDLTDIVSSKTEFVRGLNHYRDWIKHTNPSHEDSVELEDWQAFFYVQRAVNAYLRLLPSGAVPPRRSITPLGEWFEANCKRIEAMLGLPPE